MNFVTHGTLMVLSGSSGAGKNSVLRELIKIHPGLVYSISATTRPPRPGEVDGKDYFFLSEDEFQAKLAADAFLETAEVYGHWYGTPRAFIEGMLRERRDVALDIDVKGAMAIRAKMPEAVLVFLVPPNFAVLRERLENRQTETAGEIERRLAQVEVELNSIVSYDYVVVNRDLKTASEQIRSILQAEQLAIRRQDLEKLRRSLHGEEEADPRAHDQSPSR